MKTQRLEDYEIVSVEATDCLGERLLARPSASGDAERVRLRTFRAAGLDVAALDHQARAARGLLATGPSVCRRLGQGPGCVFAVYEGDASLELATLVAESQRQDFPVAVDQAFSMVLAISDVLGQATGASAGLDVVWHGFLVPQLVLLSKSGEISVLGLEHGRGLADQSREAAYGSALCAYLSPELRAGRASAPDDDVYALSALMLELLSGRPLPPVPLTAADAAILVKKAAGAERRLPLEETRALVLESIAPSGQRLPTLRAWSAELRKLVDRSGLRVGTRNLAFVAEYLLAGATAAEAKLLGRPAAAVPISAPSATSPARPASPAPASAPPPAAMPLPSTSPLARSAVRVVSPSQERPEVAAEEHPIRRRWFAQAASMAAALVLGSIVLVLWSGNREAGEGSRAATDPETTATVAARVTEANLEVAAVPVEASEEAAAASMEVVALESPPPARNSTPTAVETTGSVVVAPITNPRSPPTVSGERARPAPPTPEAQHGAARNEDPPPRTTNSDPGISTNRGGMNGEPPRLPAAVRGEPLAAPMEVAPASKSSVPPDAAPPVESEQSASRPAAEKSYSLSALSPAHVRRGSIAVVTIRGAGFTADLKASVSRRGTASRGLRVVRTVFVSASEMRMTIDIPDNALLGGYLVTLVGPDESSSNPVILEIRL